MTPVLLSLLGMGTGEMIVILIIVVLLFGSAKIPSLMRSMGKGIGEFKKGVNEGNIPDATTPPSSTPPAAPPAQPSNEQKH